LDALRNKSVSCWISYADCSSIFLQANEHLEAELMNAKETIKKQGEDWEQSEGKVSYQA